MNGENWKAERFKSPNRNILSVIAHQKYVSIKRTEVDPWASVYAAFLYDNINCVIY